MPTKAPTNKTTRPTQKQIEAYHCCFCSRDVHTLLHQSTKEGAPRITKQRSGHPTSLMYQTAKKEAICERCAGTHMMALSNGGKPVIGYERGEGKYYVAHRILQTLGQDIIEVEEDSAHLRM